MACFLNLFILISFFFNYAVCDTLLNYGVVYNQIFIIVSLFRKSTFIVRAIWDNYLFLRNIIASCVMSSSPRQR